MRRKCSALPTLREPWNIMCSKRWASPVWPGTSWREPTLYQMLTAATGASGSGDMMRRSPLPSRSSVKLTVGSVGTGGAVGAVGACPLPAVMGASVSVQVRQVGHKLEARRGVALHGLTSLARPAAVNRQRAAARQLGVSLQT